MVENGDFVTTKGGAISAGNLRRPMVVFVPFTRGDLETLRLVVTAEIGAISGNSISASVFRFNLSGILDQIKSGIEVLTESET